MAYNQIGKGAAPAAPYQPNQPPPERGKKMAGETPRPPYVHVPFPSWRYDPLTGEGQIFDSEEEVPDGWLDNPQDCGTDGKPAKKKRMKAKLKLAPTVKEADIEEEAEAPTLESLELTRAEAIELLDAEDVQFKSNASNNNIAALVSNLLEN